MKHLFWFFLLPIFSCSTSQEPAGEPFNYSAYKKMDVGFKNSTILIPNYYKEVTMADFRDNTANLFSDSLELEIRLKGFKKMEVLSDEFRIFCDSTNFQNSIWMMYGPFIELDKHQASQYLRLVETERKQIQIRKGIQFKRLENKFLQAPNSKIIKIKYRLSNTYGPMFITSYLVSTKYRTFSLNVQHVNNIDFEEMIKHFDVK